MSPRGGNQLGIGSLGGFLTQQRICPAGTLTELWRGELDPGVSSLWSVAVRPILAQPSIAASANSPLGATVQLTMGGNPGASPIRFDVAFGAAVTVPAGEVSVSIDCRTSSGPDVAELPQGTFETLVTPAGSASTMRAYLSARTGSLTNVSDPDNRQATIPVPSYADAIKVWPQVVSSTTGAFGQYMVQQIAPAAPTSDAVVVYPGSLATSYKSPDWFEIGSRVNAVRVINQDPVNAQSFKCLFRIKW